MDIYNSDYKLLKSEFKTTVNSLIQHVLCSLITCVSKQQYKNSLLPFGLNRALRNQTWLRKIDARSCVDLSSCRTNRRTFLHRFVKPCWLHKAY